MRITLKPAKDLQPGDRTGCRDVVEDVSAPFHGFVTIKWLGVLQPSTWPEDKRFGVEIPEPDYAAAVREMYPVCMNAMLGSRQEIQDILRRNGIDPEDLR